MLNCLIAIGMKNDDFQEKVFKIVDEIGEVIIDHGVTSCITPDVKEYINKAKIYKQNK